jgi:CspA family cold shock protein
MAGKRLRRRSMRANSPVRGASGSLAVPTLGELFGGFVQGVIKAYDPGTREGTLVRDLDRAEYDLAGDALAGSVFRMLRQGQRVVFDLDADGRATRLRLGSEVDMGTREPPPVP